MSRRLNRFGLLLLGLLASEAWALGLGDIRLDSALNEPLRAEIELLSASDEELENLKITLASAETFERYGIDRPNFLTRLEFSVIDRGAGQVIRVTSSDPVSEPFVTFLVEANWARGRLLREYTVLLDPPTFAPPPRAATPEAVTAPRQSSQADRGRIERPAPAPSPAPRPAAARTAPAAADFDGSPGGDYQVARGDTLWGIAQQLRPDSRLTMNQTMLAIYEANPGAFAGNINNLRANSRLRIPSSDEIFSIGRAQALNEIRRQNESWRGGTAAPRTTLTLVPPDADEQTPYQGAVGSDAAAAAATADAAARERIRQLEVQIAEQDSLLEIRDNELAELRSELARLREERGQMQPVEPQPAADDAVADTADDSAADAADDIFVDDQADATPDDAAADDTAVEPAADAAAQPPAPRVVRSATRDEPGLVDQIIAVLTGFWGIVGAALIAVLGLLVWFARRASGRGDEADSTGVWDALDADADADSESRASTERLRAMARDDDTSIVVVEQAAADDTLGGDTIESPSMYADDDSGDISAPEPAELSSTPIEDTFSSETAINLDQSDPVAEADFHMAYGLYDQAADLINGALAIEPNRTDLMAKLCEIYFVWGNRDAFVDAASRLNEAVGEDSGGLWDKVVIMGQQIAGDHALFADARAAAGSHAIDLDFEAGGESAALDIDFADDSMNDESGVIDLGAEEFAASADDALDFSFDDDTDTGASITREITQEMPTDMGGEDPTVESQALSDDTLEDTMESPTVEQPLDSLADTSELPASGDATMSQPKLDEATAEIDLDDLGLDLDGLSEALGDDADLLGDDEATSGDLADELAETGRNQLLDEDVFSKTDANIKPDDDLLDATGQTQVLSDDFTVETASNLKALDDDDATMLAPGPGAADTGEFDFAKTEALPQDSFSDDSLESTAEQPAPGATDMDLDLDDLTAALRLSESGDTVEQNRDDATVEQPRFAGDSDDLDLDLGLGADEATQALGPDDVSDDLQEARTMTEVGTKLDLARAYVDMGDPSGARNILEEVLEEGDESQRQQAQQLLDSLPS